MRTSRDLLLLPLSLPLLLSTAACRPGMLHRGFAMRTADSAAPPVRMERMSNPQVAGIVLLANNVDLSYARIALVRASNVDVQVYARRMIADHAGLNSMLEDVIGRMDMRAKEHSYSTDIRDTSSARRERLNSAPRGHDFDVAYVTTEVRYHREMLDMIDGLLMPSATDHDIVQYLQWLRPAERAHLAHAEQLLSTLTMAR